MLDLRPYQVTDIDRLRDQYAAGKRAVIYQLSTGGGKTVVFCNVVQSAADKGRRVGIFTHRRELITQASQKLEENGVAHGVMAAGLDRDHDLPVQVLSIQSAANRVLPQFDFMVFDEAHHARASTWAALIASQPKAKLLGVTATPARTDGKGLGVAHGGLFDAIVCGPSMATLVRDGYLAPATIYSPVRKIDTAGLRKVAGDYAAGEELAKRATVVTGDAVAHYQRLATGRSAIAFCVTVEHAENVADSFRAAGLRAACVHGSTPKDQRDSLIAGLGTGSLDVLTSCELISEGLDVPAVGAVLLLRPTSSLIMCLQQIGRGMRPAPGKTDLIVLDHAGNVDRHGDPEEDRIWTLDGVERAPRKAPEAGGEQRPGMGATREVEVEDGILALRERAAAEAAKWGRMSYASFKRAVRTEAQARAFAAAKGYKPGFAFMFMKEQRERLAMTGRAA